MHSHHWPSFDLTRTKLAVDRQRYLRRLSTVPPKTLSTDVEIECPFQEYKTGTPEHRVESANAPYPENELRLFASVGLYLFQELENLISLSNINGRNIDRE
jgi:hypothetical protein